MLGIFKIGLRSDGEVGDVFFGIGVINTFLNLIWKNAFQ